MTNKNWDKFHSDVFMDIQADKDLIKFLKRFYMNDLKNRNILDVGCGQGKDLAYMSYYYKQWRCYGIDYSAKALCITNHRLNHRNNVILKHCDIIDTGYEDNKFDLITDIVTFATGNIDKAIVELNRILKPKGRIFLKEFSDNECNKDNKYLRRGDDVIRFNEQQLYDLLSDNGFEKIEISFSKIKHQGVEHLIGIGRKT